MARPLVSIYIPSVGREELRDSIASVLAQDMRDFEVIVVSCAKHELVGEMVRDARDARVRHSPLPDGVPPNGTFDHGARESRGRYVFMLDDDNYMLPGALRLMTRAAERTGADFIAGGHIYYYDSGHSRHYLRNALGVVPFTGALRPFAPREGIRAFFGFERMGPRHAVPRLHPSAFMVKREVVERAFAHIGTIMFADLPNGQASQSILLSQSMSAVSLDYPVVIVGRLGKSMSQVWSTAARERFRRQPFPLEYSPVKGYTRINGTLENYLRLKERWPAIFGDIPIDWVNLAGIYLQELRYLDMELGQIVPVWRNLFAFLQTLPDPPRRALLVQARWAAVLYPAVFFSRRTGLHRLWRALRARAYRPPRSPQEAFAAKREFEVPLASHGVHSMRGLGIRAFEIIRAEVGEIPAPLIA